MNTNSIEAISLSKQYPGFALEDVSFTLPQGCIMGFIGQNGAGKTTTIKRLLGLVQGGGEVHLLGEKEGYGLRKVKEQVGVFLEGSFFNEVIRVQDIDSILPHITPRWDKGYYSFLLDRFQIPRKKYLRELSKGMGTKLRLATILARHPKLLILDEPMSGLDPVARSQVMDLFLEFIQDGEHSVFLSTHITTDLEQAADYITFIHEGKLVFSQEKDRVMEEYGLAQGTEEALKSLGPDVLIAMRKGRYHAKGLVNNRQEAARREPSLLVEPARLEDIMVMMAKEEESWLG